MQLEGNPLPGSLTRLLLGFSSVLSVDLRSLSIPCHVGPSVRAADILPSLRVSEKQREGKEDGGGVFITKSRKRWPKTFAVFYWSETSH